MNETRPSWLSNIINLLAPLALVIALVFGDVSPEQTGETAGLLEVLLDNLWAMGLILVQGIKGVLDSIKRWGQDNAEGVGGTAARAFGLIS